MSTQLPEIPPDDRKTILVVDDTTSNLAVVSGLLGPFYRVRAVNSGERALRASLADPPPDLILLDVMMPAMDGYQVLEALRQDPRTHDIPVIFLTAKDSDEDEERGLALGAVDYMTKPIRPAILQARVRTQLELKQARDWLRDQNGYLEREVARRMRENELVKDVMMHALAMLAETRDKETGNHLRRTQAYIELMMGHLQDRPRFRDQLGARQRQLIAKAAPLHDIGKVGIPDAILLKNGRLTPEEYQTMKQHCQLGADAITSAIERVLAAGAGAGLDHDESLEFLRIARQVALCHHEEWNGGGYPQGLKGDDIPLPGRLMAMADVFDALICRRHYKPAFPRDEIRRLIVEARGIKFDPEIVDAFCELEDRFYDIARAYADEPSEVMA